MMQLPLTCVPCEDTHPLCFVKLGLVRVQLNAQSLHLRFGRGLLVLKIDDPCLDVFREVSSSKRDTEVADTHEAGKRAAVCSRAGAAGADQPESALALEHLLPRADTLTLKVDLLHQEAMTASESVPG